MTKLKTYSTLINCVINEYEIEQGPLRPIGRYQLPQSSILKLTQYLTIKSQLYNSTLCILQQDTKCSGLWPTIHYIQSPHELVIHSLTK